ncbi:MAG TPA: hypothetical protein VFH95_08205 [Candidatus Kapabacteria bacterium]|nr:hypothetical protein [Candidatus Kapabacteria bacterium]
MIRSSLILLLFLSVAAIPGASARARSHPLAVRAIQFSPDISDVADSVIRLSPREEWRVEHFLGAMFPVWQMRRCAREASGQSASYLPVYRRVTYSVISQQGFRFVLVGYRAEWNDAGGGTVAVNELAIYRMESTGPNQVWRSRPWQASYPELHFWTSKCGWRNVILFQDGGSDDRSSTVDDRSSTEGEFGLASVFSFYNEPKGLYIRDLTPSFPWLRARERFPFRALYGQSISFRIDEARELILSASDEPYNIGMLRIVRPGRSWRFDPLRGRFEQMKVFTEVTSNE